MQAQLQHKTAEEAEVRLEVLDRELRQHRGREDSKLKCVQAELIEASREICSTALHSHDHGP